MKSVPKVGATGWWLYPADTSHYGENHIDHARQKLDRIAYFLSFSRVNNIPGRDISMGLAGGSESRNTVAAKGNSYK